MVCFVDTDKPVPREWFPPMQGLKILGLACGGGQQGPIFAAAGAEVTIFDNSPAQLERDREVAEREGLNIRTVEGDMRDLSIFADESFDLIFHPVSNLFIHEISPVWKEAYRVLRHGGYMLSGFMNPLFYLFDWDDMEKGNLNCKLQNSLFRCRNLWTGTPAEGRPSRRIWPFAHRPACRSDGCGVCHRRVI